MSVDVTPTTLLMSAILLLFKRLNYRFYLAYAFYDYRISARFQYLPNRLLLQCRCRVFTYLAFETYKSALITDYQIWNSRRSVHPAVFLPKEQVWNCFQIIAYRFYQVAFLHFFRSYIKLPVTTVTPVTK